MALLRATGLVALVMLMLAGPALAEVRVRFVEPDRYSDRAFSSPATGRAALDEFRRMMVRLGERTIGRGQTLTVDVLDIRLAGSVEPWRPGMANVRILRDVTPPRLRLRYVLASGGRTLLRGEETVSDMDYLANPAARGSAERFAYERAMLADWFHRRFAAQAGPGPRM